MENIVQYSMNIAMESTMILMLALLLFTCLWQKKRFLTSTPLIYLLSSIILLLIVQVVMWTSVIQNVNGVRDIIPLKIVYTLDYFFYYGVSFVFYYYIEDIVRNSYRKIGIVYKPKKAIRIIMIVWGIACSFLYGVLIFTPSLFRVENGEEIYSIPVYVFMNIIIKFACVCAIVLIIRHRKVIEKNDAILCIGFIMLISVFSIVDDQYGLCISYLLLTLLTFIIYVRIDLHKSFLIERQQKELVERKTQIMLSQMQPHFLYNVFTTISSLCEMQNAIQARDVVNRFADYFRTNLDSLGKEEMIPFEKELEHIKTYLWLEKIRFEDSLNICYEIGPTDFMLPPLTVQPIVENAVKHGILQTEDAGTIIVRTSETSQDYVITVEDDGVGFDVNEKQNDTHAHIGIENVSKRLEIICGGFFEIQSEKGKGTVVKIHIPKGEGL